jgi:hypothetical protein
MNYVVLYGLCNCRILRDICVSCYIYPLVPNYMDSAVLEHFRFILKFADKYENFLVQTLKGYVSIICYHITNINSSN